MTFVWALVLSLPAQEPLTAYRGARIHTLEGEPIDRGVLIVRGRLIEAVGADISIPEGAKVVDLSGKVVLPGLIDAYSRAFLDPEDRGPSSPEQDVADALDLFRRDGAELAARGLTAVYVAPAGTGLGAVIRVGNRPSILKRGAALHLSLARGGEISTASARHEAYRQASQLLEGAKAYREAWAKHAAERKTYEARTSAGEKNLKEPTKPALEPAKETLARALDPAAPLPLRVEAHAADSIGYALRLAEDFKLRLILEGATEAFARAEEIAKAKAQVVVGPVLQYGAPSAETLRHTPGCAGALARAGAAPLAIGSFGRDARASRFLLESAGIAVSAGLDRGRALEAVTLGAARILGIDAETGSLKKGKRADFVVLSAEPFDARAAVERCVADGEVLYARELRR